MTTKLSRPQQNQALSWPIRKVRARQPWHPPRESILHSQITLIAGGIFGALTLAFLMWVALFVDQVQCSRAGIISLVFGLGAALSTSFISGYIFARGPVSIPYLGNKPINIAAGGGFLALIAASILASIIVSRNCISAVADPGCDPSPPATAMHLCGEVAGLKVPPEGDAFLAVRTGPTTLCGKNTNSDNLYQGDKVVIHATHDKWVYILRFFPQLSPRAEGWAYANYLRMIDCPADAPK